MKKNKDSSHFWKSILECKQILTHEEAQEMMEVVTKLRTGKE